MVRLVRALLPLTLLLAFALPAQAADVAPLPSPDDVAPDGIMYMQGGYTGDLPISTAEQANEAVLATGAPFGDFVLLTPDLIGASEYYEVKGEAGSDAIWIVIYTYGWGDCQAGCINSHSFTYQVDPTTGEATFNDHSGDALNDNAPEELLWLTGRSGGVVPEPEWRTVTGEEPSAYPDGITDPGAPISSDLVLPCLLSDGSLYPNNEAGGSTTDWGVLYENWMAEYVATLEPCASDVDVNDPLVAACVLPDGTAIGPMPMFAMYDTVGADSSTGSLPLIIIGALAAWIAAASAVGWRKRRTA